MIGDILKEYTLLKIKTDSKNSSLKLEKNEL